MCIMYEETFLYMSIDGIIDQSGGKVDPSTGERTKIPCFKKMLLSCSWICIVRFKSMGPLSFDSPAKTDGVRKFPNSSIYIPQREALIGTISLRKTKLR